MNIHVDKISFAWSIADPLNESFRLAGYFPLLFCSESEPIASPRSRCHGTVHVVRHA